MTNLKRVLSLALAAVMLMGMMVIGAGAANIEYSDSADIKNDVAVTVLTGMDVLGGYPDGSFKPEATITRAEAAAVVCRIMLGSDVAETLTTATAPFADVKATNWAAGYIAYLKNLGVISGIGNNKFNPQGKVTVGEMAKMLLGAAGVTGQFTGSQWLINVTVAARQAEILDSTAQVTADATRDDVALYTFNALNYAPNGATNEYVVFTDTNSNNVVDSGETVYYRGSDAITALLMQNANSAKLIVDTVRDGSLGATVFGLKEGTVTDDFGRKSTTYTNGKTGDAKVTYGTFAPEAALTYTTATTDVKIATALGATTTEGVTLSIKENGAAKTGYGTDGVKTVEKDTTPATNLGGQGTLIQVYKTGDKAYDVVIVNTYAKKLTASDIVAAKAATATTDAQAAYIKLDSGLTYETDAFTAGDVVLYTKTASKVVDVVKADYISGNVTATASGYFRVSGEQKYLSATNTTGITIGTTDGYKVSSSIYTYYLDFYGNVILAEAGQAADVDTNYVYVIDTASKAAVTGTGDNLFEEDESSAARAQAKVINLETGVISVVNLGIVKSADGKYYYANMNGSASTNEVTGTKPISAAGIYSYTTLSDGSYVLSASAATATDVTVQKNVATLGASATGKYANSSTVLTVVEYTTDTAGNITAATVSNTTGIANFPTAATTYTGAVVTANDAGIVSEILVVQAKTTTAAANYAIYKGVGETVSDGSTGTKTKYEFYVNGEVVSYYDADGKDTQGTPVAFAAGTVYNLTVSNEEITAATPVSALNATAGTVKSIQGSYVIVTVSSADTVYYFADGYQVFDADSEYAVDTLAVGDSIKLYGSGADAVSMIVIDNP